MTGNDLLLSNFPLLFDTPDSISKLRKYILQLAVQGRLTEEWRGDNPDVEPATVIIGKIKQVKNKLLKEGKIRKEQPPSDITEEQKPFKVPDGWEWCRIADGFELKTGATPSTSKPEYYGGDIKWLVSGDINQQEIFDCKGRITALGLQSSNCKVIKPNSVLIALNGQGKTRASVAMLRTEAALNQSLVSMTSLVDDLNPDYLYCNLKSRYYELRDITGRKQRRGLNMKIVSNIVISIPPLEEQHAIVERIDALMKYCDQLEEKQKLKSEKRISLTASHLNAFTEVDSIQVMRKRWKDVSDRFYILFDCAENIKQLKQTILQLAVQGRLTEKWRKENPDVEPASVLLAKINHEKEKLLKEGKIKKEKPLPEITEEEKPFELPEGWEWCRLPDLCKNDRYTIKRGPFGSSLRKSFFVPKGYKIYEQQHAIKNDFSLGHYYIDSNKYEELKAFKVEPRDIIISCSGTIGKVAVVPKGIEPGIINQALLKVSLKEYIIPNNYFAILFPIYIMQTDTPLCQDCCRVRPILGFPKMAKN